MPPDADRLRIGLVYDARYPEHHGGAERRYHEIATRLSATHEVEYLTWRYPGDATTEAGTAYRVHTIANAPPLYGADGKRTIREAVSFATRILPTLVRRRFDVIDCSATPYVPLYACWMATRFTRTPLVVTWHEFWGDHWLSYLPRRPQVARGARRLERSARHIGEVLVPVSTFTARRMGLTDTDPRVHIVGNGVDVDEIRAARPRPGADVIYVGRLIDDKRVDVLLRAIGQLTASFPRMTCLVVGEGPERSNLEALATRLGLGDRVRFAGNLSSAEVYGHLKAARVMALPSVREGFGIAVLEAQAAGAVPIVVRSPASAAPDLIQEGVDGLVCDPSAESLALSISRLLGDAPQRHVMAQNARRSARQRDWSSVAHQMEQIYREVVTATRPMRRRRLVSPSCP